MNQNDANKYRKPIRRVPPIRPVSAAEGIRRLILQYAGQHHPLAAGIARDDLPLLTLSLAARMAQAGQGLRTSVRDSRHLHNALRGYARWATGRGQPPITYAPLVDSTTPPAPVPGPERIGFTPLAPLPESKRAGFTDEDHLSIVREIAAWHGNALLLEYPGAAWLNPGTLLDVAVEVTGNLHVDGRTVRRMVMNVGGLAALAWDRAVYGKAHHYDPIIWDTYDE